MDVDFQTTHPNDFIQRGVMSKGVKVNLLRFKCLSSRFEPCYFILRERLSKIQLLMLKTSHKLKPLNIQLIKILFFNSTGRRRELDKHIDIIKSKSSRNPNGHSHYFSNFKNCKFNVVSTLVLCLLLSLIGNTGEF